MPKCPKCGEEINHFNVEKVKKDPSKTLSKKPFWEWVDDLHSSRLFEVNFKCPECGYVIANDLEKAKQLLKQE